MKHRFNKCLSVDNNYKKLFIIVVIFCFALMFTSYSSNPESVMTSLHLNRDEWIIASVYKSNEKSDLWLIDTQSYKKKILLSNREVMANGKINSKGDILIYADAIGNNPWNIFKLNLKTKNITQITDDAIGRFNLNFADEKGDIIFSKSGGLSSPVPKIERLNVNKNESKIFNNLGADVAVLDFDIYNDKIIALTYPFSEDIKRNLNQKKFEELPPIEYNIVELDFQGKITKEIIHIRARDLDSIKFSASGNSIILGGNGIMENGIGFYRIDFENGKVSNLLLEEELKKSGKINKFSRPYIPCLSADEKRIYFVAIPSNAEIKNFNGLMAYHNVLYCYDLQEKKLAEILNITDTFITNISVTYR